MDPAASRYRHARSLSPDARHLARLASPPPARIPEPFRFFDLPPDIRNNVYQMMFEGVDVEIESHFSDSDLLERVYTRAPNVLLSSRQLYKEGVGMYYCYATFTVVEVKVLLAWLGGLSPAFRAHLRSIHWDVLCYIRLLEFTSFSPSGRPRYLDTMKIYSTSQGSVIDEREWMRLLMRLPILPALCVIKIGVVGNGRRLIWTRYPAQTIQEEKQKKLETEERVEYQQRQRWKGVHAELMRRAVRNGAPNSEAEEGASPPTTEARMRDSDAEIILHPPWENSQDKTEEKGRDGQTL